MKIMMVILNFVSISKWPFLTSIVAVIKTQKEEFKESFLKINSSNLSGYKILSKIYNNKYVGKRYFACRKTIDENSDFHNDHGKHPTETRVYYDQKKDFHIYAAMNGTTTNKNVICKLAELGVLHKIKPVYLYDKVITIELKTVEDVNQLLNYLKDTKMDSDLSNKINKDLKINNILDNVFESELKNKHGCEDLINLTVNITKDKEFNKVLFIIAKDLKNKKID